MGAGIPDFDGFKDNINKCSAWSGNFGGRKKRAVGEAPEENEEVPSLMESGNGALQWVKSLVRRARNVEPAKGDGKNNGGKKRNRKNKPRKGKKEAKEGGKGKGNRKNKPRKGKARKGSKGSSRKKGGNKNKDKKKKNDKKKNRKGKQDKQDKKGKEDKEDKKNRNNKEKNGGK